MPVSRIVILACSLTLCSSNNGFCQMIVGHRGASGDAPENTIAAFQEAWEQDADGIEGDFYLTSDKHIVCIHDKDTLRTGGTKLLVAKSSLAQLRELEYGSWKNSRFQGEQIPTFADVVRCIPEGKTFVIELKAGPKIVPILKQQCAEYELNLSTVLIISFNEQTIVRAKQLLPDARAHWLTSYKQNEKTGVWHPTTAEIAETLKACHADGLGTQGKRSVVTRQFIQELKKYGMREFHVWTIDEASDATYFQELGAIGITTNRPAHIRDSLKLP